MIGFKNKCIYKFKGHINKMPNYMFNFLFMLIKTNNKHHYKMIAICPARVLRR